ncbi:MAG: FMN-binding protein [Clostridia bacterium]|nr:FMN-binding protein [Clostridia bacterium]
MVDTQGQTVDAVSGVTISSDAIREAAGEILAQASAGEAAPVQGSDDHV